MEGLFEIASRIVTVLKENVSQHIGELEVKRMSLALT